MKIKPQTFGKLLGAATGAALAGPAGTVVGGITGELLSTLLPHLPAFLNQVSSELTADSVTRLGEKLVASGRIERLGGLESK